MPVIVELDYNPWIERLSCFLPANSASLAGGQFQQASPAPGFMQANSQSKGLQSKSKFVLAGFFLLVICSAYFVSASTTERAFKRGDDRFVELFDSGVFLMSAKTILQINEEKKRSATGQASKARQKELADMLIVDGPVLPLIAAKAILLGQTFHLSMPYALSVLESIIQSLVSGLVFILAWRATGNKFLALAAGLLWGLYPPAVIATQRLVSENLCAALLLAVSLCFDIALKAKNANFSHLLPLAYAGFFFALMLLTKPVMMFCVLFALAFLLVCLRWKRAATGLAAFSAATIITMLPFWVFTKEATGKIFFIPQRYPILNAIVTNSLITDGYHGLPTQQASNYASGQTSVIGVEVALFMEDPLGHTDLNIRKLARIFAEPWNDFRRTAVFLNAQSIRFTHQLLAVFAMGALALGLTATISALQISIKKIEFDQFTLRNSTAAMLVLAVIGHLIYTGFEGIPRYGFTATPLFVVLLFWAIEAIRHSHPSKLQLINLIIPPILLVLLSNLLYVENALGWLSSPISAALALATAYAILAAWFFFALQKITASLSLSSKLMKTSVTIIFLLFTITTGLCLLRESREAEIAARISGPAVAMRELSFSKRADSSDTPQWALLLVDASKEIEHAHITVNGHRIREAPKSVFHFYQKKFDLLSFMEEMAKDINVNIENVRQWRAVPIPIEYLSQDGKNQIRISSPSGAPLTVYGDFAAESPSAGIALPTYEIVSHSRIFVSVHDLDWRPRVKFTIPTPSQSQIEYDEPKYPLAPQSDLSSAPGIQKGQWRMMIALGYAGVGKTFESETKCVRLSPFNFKEVEVIPGKKDDFLTFNTACHCDYLLKPQEGATHVLAEFKGKGQAVSGDRQQAVVSVRLDGITTSGDNPDYYDCKGQPKPETLRLPGTAQVVTFNKGKDTEFLVKALYPINAVRGRGHHLTIELLPIPEGTALTLKEAELSVKELSWPDLGQQSVFVY